MQRGKFHLLVKYSVFVFAIIISVFVFIHFRDASLHGDSGLFAGMATHLLHGKVLYRDVWDNKPPGIFLLYAFFQWMGNGNPMVFHWIQAMFIGLISGVILSRCRVIFPKQILVTYAVIPVLLFAFMNWPYYLNGFYIEEYGLGFFVFACALLTGKRRTNAGLIMAGVLSSMAVICKEPFVFLFAGMVLFIGLTSQKKVRNILIFGSGAVIPFLGILIYLIANKIVPEYLHYLSFAFGYSGITGDVRPGWWAGVVHYHSYMNDIMPYYHLFLWAGIGSVFDREFSAKSRNTSLLWMLLFVFSSGIPALGMVQYGHYFMPMAIFGALLTLNGIFWLIGRISEILQKIFTGISKIKLLTLILFVTYILYFNGRSYRFLFKEKYTQTIGEKEERREVVRITKDTKQLYVDMEYYGYYYFFTGKISGMPFPTPMLGYFDESAGKKLAVENREKFKQKFATDPPDGIITGKKFSAAIIYSGMEEYALSHYELRDSFETCTGAKALFWSLKKQD